MNAFKYLSLAALITTLGTVAAQDNDAAKKDLAAFQGEWSMVSGSADGQPIPEGALKEMKRVCKGNEVTVTVGSQTILKATITIDPSAKPKTIDYEVTGGANNGKKQLGIYELDGDSFKSCFAAPGDPRPADFTGKEGEHRIVSVWKRQKESAAKPEEKK